jgi:hypothetical protein
MRFGVAIRKLLVAHSLSKVNHIPQLGFELGMKHQSLLLA